MPRYIVQCDDNFHYQDESERTSHGNYATAGEAIAKCRQLVDEELNHLVQNGALTEELYELYVNFAADPFIVPLDGAAPVSWDAWGYAKDRAAQKRWRLLAQLGVSLADPPLAPNAEN
jgi:hypothetical protein